MAMQVVFELVDRSRTKLQLANRKELLDLAGAFFGSSNFEETRKWFVTVIGNQRSFQSFKFKVSTPLQVRGLAYKGLVRGQGVRIC